jgi:hypothetical protein
MKIDLNTLDLEQDTEFIRYQKIKKKPKLQKSVDTKTRVKKIEIHEIE